MSKNFVVYNSSAGSGKTYTLIKEYLKIALGTPDVGQYKQILAVTFTNKAAAEMKERVISTLQALSSATELEGTSKFLQQDLLKSKEEGGIGISDTEIQRRSKKVLQSILHNYNDFGISTIDKFMHKIVRTFAHDLSLPLNFDIELDENEVLGRSIDMLISEVGVNKDLTKLLIEYTNKKAEEEENWHIEKDLFTFSKNLLKDDGELYLKKIRKLNINDFDKIKKDLYQQAKSFEEKVKGMAQEALELIKSKGIETTSFSASFFPKYWNDLLTLKKFKPTDTTIKIIAGERGWYAKTVEQDQQQLIDSNQQEFIQLYSQSRKYLDDFESEYVVGRLITKNLYNLAVLNEIEKTILAFKQDNNVLNISDFNKKIADIINSEPVPFIYERLGEKYNHYLIDEFQDTSIIQWHNIIPLVENSLSKGKFNMVVGDAKQAIYRFRGGEVEQIINLPAVHKSEENPLLEERVKSLARNYHSERLNTNFRSKREVVEFNNQFFKSVSANLSSSYQELYSELEQQFDAKNTGGGVSVQFLKENGKEEYDQLMFDSIIAIISKNTKDGYSLNDMVVLTRSNKDGTDIAAHLIENGIEVISSESLLLNSSEKVRFLMNLLQNLANPSEKAYQLPILNYLISNEFPSENLLDIFTKYPSNTLRQFLQEKKLNFYNDYIANFSLYELVEYLIKHFSVDKGVDIYVQFFIDKVYQYATKKDNSVVNFIEWWNNKSEKFSIVVPDGINAVKVMSIHKSKGLEFPVVIYPYATSSVKISEPFFWTDNTNINGLDSAILPINKALKETNFVDVYNHEMDKSILDLINVLYVALTRPKDRLFILSRIKENKKGTITRSTNGSVSDYLYDFCKESPSNKVTDTHYIFGEIDNKVTPKVNNKVEDEGFTKIVYNNWRDKIKVSYQAPEVWEVENPETIGEYGKLIHKILSDVIEISDLDNVLEDYLSKGIISAEELPAIQNELHRVFELPEVKYLFSDFDEVKNEASILLRTGEWYQPDRVMFKDNKTIIIDYKTGKKEKKHLHQIENYKVRLAEMGYTQIESYLLYIKEAELERC